MSYVIQNQSGLYFVSSGRWVKDKREAARFSRYVDAFNHRPAGGVVKEA